MEILIPAPDLDLSIHPHLSKDFGEVLTPASIPMGLGAWNPEGNFFENSLQDKRCSSGCKDNYGKFGPRLALTRHNPPH